MSAECINYWPNALIVSAECEVICLLNANIKWDTGTHWCLFVGLARAVYVHRNCVHDRIFGDFPAKNTVYLYTVYVRFWPNLLICVCYLGSDSFEAGPWCNIKSDLGTLSCLSVGYLGSDSIEAGPWCNIKSDIGTLSCLYVCYLCSDSFEAGPLCNIKSDLGTLSCLFVCYLGSDSFEAGPWCTLWSAADLGSHAAPLPAVKKKHCKTCQRQKQVFMSWNAADLGSHAAPLPALVKKQRWTGWV